MSFLDLLLPWRKTAGWLEYEQQALQLIANNSSDRRFTSILQTQIEGVFEVRRWRRGKEYESWPAFKGHARFFADCNFAQLARIEAVVLGGRAVVQVGIGGGMVGKLAVSGESLPNPHRIVLDNPVVVELTVPAAPELPQASPWIANLVSRGLVERGDTPLNSDERLLCIQKLPGLPADFLEFCEQSEGGFALPQTEQFAILGLRDINVVELSGGQTFVPLVDMRESGGLALLVGAQGIYHIAGSHVAPYASSFKDALNRLASDIGAA